MIAARTADECELLREIECQLEPNVTGSGAIGTNKNIAECHCPSPGLSRQRYAWETPAETTRSS